MVQLRPQQSFTVVRQIANHLDTDINYVQAVIRNAYTDAIIDTIQLTNKGSQRFSKNWQVPADPSGNGFYISIVTSVYTDSGYTTKNPNYGDEENTHLVMEMRQNLGGGGVDSYTIRRIFKEEIENAKPEPVKPEKKEKVKEIPMRWDEILEAIRGIETAINALPKNPTDLTPVISGLNEAIKAIEEKEVTPPTDLSPIMEKFDADKNERELTHSQLVDVLKAFSQNLTGAVEEMINKELQGVKWTSSFVTQAEKGETPKAEMPEEEPILFDINDLAL